MTNIHGKMEGQDILARVEVIQKEKEKKKEEAESRKKSKERLNELFYKCKSKCFCVGPCNAKGFKECPNCNSITKLIYSKTDLVASVEMECLMAKVGSGDVLQDVISGLLLVIPKARDSRLYQVLGDENLKSFFKIYQTIDKDLLMETF